MDDTTRDLIIEQQKLKGKTGTYKNQWWTNSVANCFLFRRNPKFSVPFSLFNRNYFLWDDPANKDPAHEIMSIFGSQIDGCTYDSANIKGIVSDHRGRRLLNIPDWPELEDEIAAKAVA